VPVRLIDCAEAQLANAATAPITSGKHLIGSSQCAATAGDPLGGGSEPVVVPSVCCDGGSRARAMLTRQPYWETDTVPSLHSNLAAAASAAAAGFSAGVAAGWGAGACASGFGDNAQPAHDREINRTRSIRMRKLPKNRSSSGAAGRPPPTDAPVSALSIQWPGLIRTSSAGVFRWLDGLRPTRRRFAGNSVHAILKGHTRCAAGPISRLRTSLPERE
jgi:hypothetical protein